jgi:LmbE family N-acetylglucosaminyl deacetylase
MNLYMGDKGEIRKALLVLLWAIAFAGAPLTGVAQTPTQITIVPTPDSRALEIDRGSAALWQLLLKLHTRASLINIVGHPDDEAGAMLTYEGRGQGVRTSLLQMNRGEGGQNAMSDDFYDALGLDRTEELMASDRFYGTVQHFVMVPDLGFAKTKEDALNQWTHERVLGDVVRAVRMERPLVITSENVGGPTDGHGHHQVAGETAQEVFKAAGDPNAFPEQIREGLRPWTPLKMYARAPSPKPQGIFDAGTGQYLPVRFHDYLSNTWIEGLLPANVRIPTGTYDPLLAGYYTQISHEGLDNQKTQGQGSSIPEPQPTVTSYHRFASLVKASDSESSFFEGIDTSLMGIADLAHGGDAAFLRASLEKINTTVETAIGEFSAIHPDKVAPALADGLKATSALIAQVQASTLTDEEKYNVRHELKIKQTQFNNALAVSLGLSLDAEVETSTVDKTLTPFDFAIPGQKFSVNVHMADQGAEEVVLDHVWLEGPEKEDWASHTTGKNVSGKLQGNTAVDQHFSLEIPENAAPTKPYFTRASIEQPYYDVTDSRYRTLPFGPYPLAAWAQFVFDGATVQLAQVVQRGKREPGLGTVLEPIQVAPAISVAIVPKVGIVPLNEREFNLAVVVKSQVKGPAHGMVKLTLPSGWRSNPVSAPFSTLLEDEQQTVSFRIYPAALTQKDYTVDAVASFNGQEYTSGFVTTGYPGLRSHNLYSRAAYRTSGVDVKVAPGLKVGYIEGTGDDVPKSLENLGIKVDFLSAQDIASGDLHKFNVVVLGIRTYGARPELAVYNERLLDYVKSGGVVIVQYQSAQYDHNFGPYPLELGTAERVVEEDGEAQILNPKSPALSWPNQITMKDFGGWVEERGHGFLGKWDPHYETPIEMHDPGQPPQDGGLLIAHYGRGIYVYTAYALYRQLPEGVPGGYRLFANLLSLAQNPELKKQPNVPDVPRAMPH